MMLCTNLQDLRSEVLNNVFHHEVVKGFRHAWKVVSLFPHWRLITLNRLLRIEDNINIDTKSNEKAEATYKPCLQQRTAAQCRFFAHPEVFCILQQ